MFGAIVGDIIADALMNGGRIHFHKSVFNDKNNA